MRIFRGRKGSDETATLVFGDETSPGPLLPHYFEPTFADAASTLAATVAARTMLSPDVHAQLIAELDRHVRAGAQLQWGNVTVDGLFDAAVDPAVLVHTAKGRFSGDQFPGLADLRDAQEEAVFAVLPAIGLADRPAGSHTLLITFPTGGSAIVETIGGLHATLPDDDPVAVAFTAATDAVLWGAVAVQAAEILVDPSSAPVVTASTPSAKVADPVVAHVLSFPAFEAAFEVQAEVFDQIPSATQVRMTNPADNDVARLMAHRTAGPPLGQSVVVVDAPSAAAETLARIAVAHDGVLHTVS